MLIEEKLRELKLSTSQEAVAKFILDQKIHIKDITIKEIAERNFTSTTTVVRLAKKLGYLGYEELKENYIKEVMYLNTHCKDIDGNHPFHRDDNIQRMSSKITSLAKEVIR